jgi:hypothetical protein
MVSVIWKEPDTGYIIPKKPGLVKRAEKRAEASGTTAEASGTNG